MHSINRADLLRPPFEHEWFGTVTKSNIEPLRDRIANLLAGNRFTMVTVNECNGFRPETRVHQVLKGSVSGAPDGDPSHVHFHPPAQITVCDSYGVWSISTNAESGRDTTAIGSPYVVCNEHQLTIEFVAIAGFKVFWQVTIEGKL